MPISKITRDLVVGVGTRRNGQRRRLTVLLPIDSVLVRSRKPKLVVGEATRSATGHRTWNPSHLHLLWGVGAEHLLTVILLLELGRWSTTVVGTMAVGRALLTVNTTSGTEEAYNLQQRTSHDLGHFREESYTNVSGILVAASKLQKVICTRERLLLTSKRVRVDVPKLGRLTVVRSGTDITAHLGSGGWVLFHDGGVAKLLNEALATLHCC